MSYICDIPKTFCNLREEDGSCRLKRPCLPIVEQCEGCERTENGYCKAYIAPQVKWGHGSICPMATHLKIEEKKKKVKIGQKKQTKW